MRGGLEVFPFLVGKEEVQRRCEVGGVWDLSWTFWNS